MRSPGNESSGLSPKKSNAEHAAKPKEAAARNADFDKDEIIGPVSISCPRFRA